MMLRPRLHDLYIGRTVLLTVLATWAVLLGLDVVLALSGEFEELGKGSYSIGHAIAWVAYTVPRRAYTLFPMAAVIGSLMGLGQLAATSELTALRALGLSRRRLALSVAIALSLLTALMVVSGETVGPWGQARADLLRNSARANTDLTMARYSGLWAREGDTFLNAQSGEERLSASGGSELVLNQVRLYRLGSDGQLAEVTYAETARHDGQGWSLHQVRRDLLGERSASREVIDQQAWDSQLDPDRAGGRAGPTAQPVGGRAALQHRVPQAQRAGCARLRGQLLEPLVLPDQRAGAVPGRGAVCLRLAALRRHGQAPVPGHPVCAGLLAAADVLRADGRRVAL
jgi:Predicted permeases